MLIKVQRYPNEVKELLDYFIAFYDNSKPFTSIADRASYTPTSIKAIGGKYSYVLVSGTLSMDGIAIILELFCICEKQTIGAHQLNYNYK